MNTGDLRSRVELLLNRPSGGGATRLSANDATLVLYNCSARESCASCASEFESKIESGCSWVPSEQRCVFNVHYNDYLMRSSDSANYFAPSLLVSNPSACPLLTLVQSNNVLIKRPRRDQIVALPSDAPFDLQFMMTNALTAWSSTPYAENHSCRVALADQPVGALAAASVRTSALCPSCLEFGLRSLSVASLPAALLEAGLQCQRRLGANELSANSSSPIFAPCRQANESLSLRVTCTFHQYALQPKLFDYDFSHTVYCT